MSPLTYVIIILANKAETVICNIANGNGARAPYGSFQTAARPNSRSRDKTDQQRGCRWGAIPLVSLIGVYVYGCIPKGVGTIRFPSQESEQSTRCTRQAGAAPALSLLSTSFKRFRRRGFHHLPKPPKSSQVGIEKTLLESASADVGALLRKRKELI